MSEQEQGQPDGSEFKAPSLEGAEQLSIDPTAEEQIPGDTSTELSSQGPQEQIDEVGIGVLDVAGVNRPAFSGERDDSPEQVEADNVDRINKDFIHLDVAHNSRNLDDISNNFDGIISDLDNLINKGADVNQLLKKVDLIDHFLLGEDDEVKKPQLLSAIFASSLAIDKLSPANMGIYLSELLAAGVDANRLAGKAEPQDIQYYLDELLAAGARIDINKLVERLNPEELNVRKLLSAGADANLLVDKYDRGHRGLYAVIQDVESLLSAGADANILIEKLDPNAIVYTLDKLRQSDAHIDVDKLVSELDQTAVANNLDELLAAGAHIDINHLVDEFDPSVNSRIVDKLLAHGADIDKLINRIQFWAVNNNFDKLVAAGANINQLARRYVFLEPEQMAKYLDKLIGAGVDINHLAESMKPDAVFYNLDKLQQAGANIDINQLAEKIGAHGWDYDTLNKLVNAGADVNRLVDVFNPNSYGSHSIIHRLLDIGADPSRLAAKLDSHDTSSFLSDLIRLGVDAGQLAERIKPKHLNDYNFKLLVNAGVDPRELTSRMSKDNVVDLLERMTRRDSRNV